MPPSDSFPSRAAIAEIPAAPAVGAISSRSIAMVFLLAVLWGSGFAFNKIAVETLPPITIAALRASGGALTAVALLGRHARLLWSAQAQPRHYPLQAFFNCVLPWILVAWASKSLASGLTTILNSTSPIFIFAITWGVTRHEPATARRFTGVVLGLVGVTAVIGMDALHGLERQIPAEIACVVGAFSYAVAGVMGRRFSGVSPIVPTAGATLVAAAILVPLAVLVEGWPAHASMRSLAAVAALGILSTGLGFIVYFRLLTTIGPIATSSQAYLRIVIGVAAGVVFLGEKPTLSMIVGLLFVTAGIVIMTMRRR